MTVKRTVRVLAVEDSPSDQYLIRRALQTYGDIDFEVEVLPSTKGLDTLLEKINVDLLLLDYDLPGRSGLEFLQSLPIGLELPPIIMLTGSGDELVAKEAILAGASDYFLKSRIEPEALGTAISECLERAAREKAARREKLETERLAVIDALTDLYNRRYLADALRHECGRISRYGGDEFFIVLTETNHEGALHLAERLRTSIADQCRLPGGRSAPVTASIGVFTAIGRANPHADMLIEGADLALRRAKMAGKNQVHAASTAILRSP